MTMKSKAYVLLLMALLTTATVGVCGGDNDDTIEQDSNTESKIDNVENHPNDSSDIILGVWTLVKFDRGWGLTTDFLSNEVMCSFNNDGTVVVKNETDVDLSPFVNKGVFQYAIISIDKIVINNKIFSYHVNNSNMWISKNVEADGELYFFVKQ